MWTIRQEQAEVFRQNALQKFEDEMVEHLNDFAPKFCEVRGEPCIRLVIRLGIERAARYGFTNRGPVRFYVELMLTFGCDFDTDFQLPWVGEVLRKEDIDDQIVRADVLFARYCDYTEQVSGPKMVYGLDALRKLNLLNPAPLEISGFDFEDWIIARLKRVFPQKCSYSGDAILRQLIRKAHEVATMYEVSSPLGITTIVGLMFAAGHAVVGDLLYPWVVGTLSDRRVGDPNVRAERLYRKAMLYCEHVLEDAQAG